MVPQEDEAALDDLEDVCAHLCDAEIKDDVPDAVQLLRVAQLGIEYVRLERCGC